MNRRPSFDDLLALAIFAFALLSAGATLHDLWSAPDHAAAAAPFVH